eukprot:1160370-Pelagomonas_calceolata.AAC.6
MSSSPRCVDGMALRPFPFSFLAAQAPLGEPTLVDTSAGQCTSSSAEHDEAELQERSMLPDADTDEQARLRREKNRLAAKRCRQKKNEMIRKIQVWHTLIAQHKLPRAINFATTYSVSPLHM